MLCVTSEALHMQTAMHAQHLKPHISACDAADWNVSAFQQVHYCMLQRLPAISCGVTVVSIAYILFALSSPHGLRINTLTPQGAIVVMTACGMAVCTYTCLFAPCSIRRFGYIRPAVQIRRMNLLGLVSFYMNMPW